MRFALGDGGSLKDRVLRSGLWVGVSEASVALLGVIRSIALARLLTPDMFGLMGLAMIVVRAVETFTRPGVAQALIARQRNFEEASGTAFTMLTIRGVLLALCLIVAAPWIAKFYDRPQLGWLLGALSGVFVLGGFNNINLIARQRELDFRNISLLGQATNLVGTTLTITLAWMLRSVWALVIGQLAQVGLNALLSYYFVPGRVTFAWDRGVARELMSYGKFITGSSIVLYIATEIDSAVIGKVLGTEQLGFYTLAFTIAHLATTNLSKIASSIMMPAYSKLQTDIPALRAAFLRTLSLLMLVLAPATAGILVCADPLVHVVYGTRWADTALPLQVLAFFGLIRGVAAFNGYLFEGMGLPRVAFQLGIIRLGLVAVIIVPMTRTWGLAGTAWAMTAGMAAQWLFGLPHLKRHVGISLADLARASWRPAWTSLVMGGLVYALSLKLDGRSVGGLAALVACGIAVYGLLNFREVRAIKRPRTAV